MVILTLHFAYWRWDKSMWNDTNHMMIRIYRVSSIPSPEMISNNETEGWDNTTRWSDRFYLKDNGMPVNFATLTLSFFALSAIFHFMACVLGLWEAFWFWYWRQLDDGFAWWRYAEFTLEPTHCHGTEHTMHFEPQDLVQLRSTKMASNAGWILRRRWEAASLLSIGFRTSTSWSCC